MAVIAIYSAKGGVGKTTLAANLAWCSATASDRNTLLWDLDASGGSTFLYGFEPPVSNRISAVFTLDRDPTDQTRNSGYRKLDILRADESARDLDLQLQRVGGRKRLARLTTGLAHDYERIILDCPPVNNELSRQVLGTADIVIVPLPPSPLSVRAFDTISKDIEKIGARRPSILPVLSMVDMRRNLHRHAKSSAPRWPLIPMASAIELSAVRRAPVGTFAPRSTGAQSIARLWDGIEQKIVTREIYMGSQLAS